MSTNCPQNNDNSITPKNKPKPKPASETVDKVTTENAPYSAMNRWKMQTTEEEPWTAFTLPVWKDDHIEKERNAKAKGEEVKGSRSSSKS